MAISVSILILQNSIHSFTTKKKRLLVTFFKQLVIFVKQLKIIP